MAKSRNAYRQIEDFDPKNRYRKKKMLYVTPGQLRNFARAIDDLSRKIHRIADDMPGAGVPKMAMIPQGLLTIIEEKLPEIIEKEVEARYRQALKDVAAAIAQQE